MKVALLLTQDRGGPVEATVDLARELLDRPRGVEPLVIGPGPAIGAGRIDGHFHPVTVRSAGDRRGRAELRRLLARLGPDVVHAQDRRAGLMTALGAAGPAVATRTLHGVPDHCAGWNAGPAGPVPRRVRASDTARVAGEALSCRRAAALVAPSEAMARFARRWMAVPPTRVRVIPNGVAAVGKPRGADRAGRPVEVFVSVGSFAPAKSVPRLVEAFAMVAATRPRLRLVLVGDGAEAARCREMAVAAGLAGRVQLTGWQRDVATHLARADAFVLPSRNENLPLALLEAMAAGLPCVASGVGGVPEVLAGGAGIVVEPGDSSALARAMADLADHPDRAARLGAAGAARVRDRFTISGVADAYAELWHEVGSRRR